MKLLFSLEISNIWLWNVSEVYIQHCDIVFDCHSCIMIKLVGTNALCMDYILGIVQL